MSAEVALRSNNILDDLQWARAAAQADILPAAYKARPGNLIVAAQLGRALGLHPMVAVTQIYVVEGKPSTSSLLIGALVRKAGHKLRVEANNSYATVTIIRHDDPDYEYKVTWRLKKGNHSDPNAEEAGLTRKDNWVKYAASMLVARAVAQCARMACGEALLGVAHTTEELNPDMETDQYGGAVQTERVTFEDMYAELIRGATTTEELKRYHGEAKTAGVLKMVPTGEERTVLVMLNEKMRELKDALPESQEEESSDGGNTGGSEGQSGSVESETMAAEDTAGSGQDYLSKPVVNHDDPAYDVLDAEIVSDGKDDA